MKLLKELGTRTTVSKTGNKDTRSWGLFECPSCNKAIELKTFKGVANKTCGKAGCRKRQATFNPHNGNFPQEDKLSNLPFYSSFVDYYRSVIKLKVTTWETVGSFRKDMYDSYVLARATSNKVTLFLVNEEVLTSSNCKWVPTSYKEEDDYSLDVTNNILHTLMLANVLVINHSVVVRALAKMGEDFGEYAYKSVSKSGLLSRPTKAYHLTDAQYTRLKERLLDSKRSVPSNVYLMQSHGTTKIGIASNVDKRLKALIGSNVLPVTLLFHASVSNALAVEKYLHTKYAKYNTHHEWFDLTPIHIKEITEYLTAQPK